MLLNFNAQLLARQLFIERTKAYQSIDIIPIWILARKNIKRIDAQEFKISAFQWLFVTGSSIYPYLWTYCPERNLFSAIKGITPFSPSTALR